MQEYLVVDPPNPLPGSLVVLLPAQQAQRFDDLVAANRFVRYTVRAVLVDNMPLSGDLHELVRRSSSALLHVNGDPLVLHLQYASFAPLMYELYPTASGALSHIDLLIETNHPVGTLGLARTAVNQLLDVLLRNVWLPLVIFRLDVFVGGEDEPLIHQLILPFMSSLIIGPLGGLGSFAELAPYEALLREAIGAASPYYRFLCAYRLLDGVKYLRGQIRKLVDQYTIQERMPRPPIIEAAVIQGLGFDRALADTITNTDDLINGFNNERTAVAHALLSKDSAQPLHISDGNNYRHYSCAAALLLHYAYRSVADLMVYYNKHVYGPAARGSILVLPEDRDRYVFRFDAYAGRFVRPEDEEDNVNRPMFITVVDGPKVEFINISYVVRIEILHPHEGQPGSGTLHLQDGSFRTLDENEINWIMRMMAGLLGELAPGTQSREPGYWTGTKTERKASDDEEPSPEAVAAN